VLIIPIRAIHNFIYVISFCTQVIYNKNIRRQTLTTKQGVLKIIGNNRIKCRNMYKFDDTKFPTINKEVRPIIVKSLVVISFDVPFIILDKDTRLFNSLKDLRTYKFKTRSTCTYNKFILSIRINLIFNSAYKVGFNLFILPSPRQVSHSISQSP